MKFGEKIRALRKQKKLTQGDMAKELGISLRTYVGYEQDGRYPRRREMYARMAAILGCDVNWLLTEDEEFITAAGESYGSRGRRQAQELVEQLSGLFAGGELTEADRDAVMIALQKVYFDCKADNRKYAPGSGEEER